eukprot:scaffold77679_cov53-Phaeocystis_antarctica.AAC.1
MVDLLLTEVHLSERQRPIRASPQGAVQPRFLSSCDDDTLGARVVLENRRDVGEPTGRQGNVLAVVNMLDQDHLAVAALLDLLAALTGAPTAGQRDVVDVEATRCLAEALLAVPRGVGSDGFAERSTHVPRPCTVQPEDVELPEGCGIGSGGRQRGRGGSLRREECDRAARASHPSSDLPRLSAAGRFNRFSRLNGSRLRELAPPSPQPQWEAAAMQTSERSPSALVGKLCAARRLRLAPI